MAKHSSEHRCRRWWREGLECPFQGLDEHEEDEDEPVEEGAKKTTPALTRQERAFVSEPAKVPARAKASAVAKATAGARIPIASEPEEPLRVVSSSKGAAAIALSALVATAAHLASGRKGPGKGTFRAAEIMAAKTAGRFSSPAPRGGGGGGFHFQVQDFKRNLIRRKVSGAEQGPGQAPASGGF